MNVFIYLLTNHNFKGIVHTSQVDMLYIARYVEFRSSVNALLGFKGIVHTSQVDILYTARYVEFRSSVNALLG